jgi:hypothetical protein
MLHVLIRRYLCVVSLFAGTTSLWAIKSPMAKFSPAYPEYGIRTEEYENTAIFESLRRDVFRHPADFITFETRAAANLFIGGHEDAEREIEPRISSRGVMGYWRGKTLVVLPSVPRIKHARYLGKSL